VREYAEAGGAAYRAITAEEVVAWVACQRQVECQRCAEGRGCGGGVLGRLLGDRLHKIRAATGSVAVAPGDQVLIGLGEDVVLRAAAAVYLVPLLLALGRLHPNKAFDVLLRALADLPDAVLWLGGDGPERAALAALAGTLGVTERVRFLGWRQDTAPLYAAADVVVVPSRHEPLGNVVLEGWARRRPVVAAASAGPAALIADGISGRLVPVDDASALSSALAQLLADPAAAARLAVGGEAAWQAGYTEAAVRDRYLEFFRRVTI
jgi:glycosyltransferase involved in cell wall biosynthesis